MSLSPFVTSSSSVAAASLSSNRQSATTTPIRAANNASSRQHQPQSQQQQETKWHKVVEKVLSDLESLGKKLIQISRREVSEDDNEEYNEPDENNSGEVVTIRDDCYELQKFCFKLEFLLQFELKEKKSASGFLSSQPSTPTSIPHQQVSTDNGSGLSSMSAYLKREYWSFVNDALRSSRSFQDAIKYAKSINEIKSPLGKARAFIRFCLQYHRLADAVQQLMMEQKVVSNWYLDKAIWHKESYKTRVIQLLYDLSDVKFDLISKNNFELDTTWPTCELQNNKKYQTSRSSRQQQSTGGRLGGRTRGNSISSFISTTTISINPTSDASPHLVVGGDNSLLSSTPLEMDDDFLFSASMSNQSKSILYDKTNANDQDERSLMLNDVEHNSYWTSQIEQLREELNAKSRRNEELSECLLKQTTFCENLSSLLRTSDERNKELESRLDKNTTELAKLQEENAKLRQDLDHTVESSNKSTGGDLAKELADQSRELEKLRDESCGQQTLIKQLQHELNVIKQERENEIDSQDEQLKQNKIQLQLKEEEVYLLNDQIQKLSRSLDAEQKQNSFLSTEIAELKEFYKNVNEKNNALIAQLEADNTEIKKRLVKLIKEKAELWQKADNLEYENLLKNNAMWMDDSNVSNCMSCNNTFSLMLRKHHCRICLKIYCYYCCNCWIEYNNSKLRVCKKCFDLKTNPSGHQSVDVVISSSAADSTTGCVVNDQMSPCSSLSLPPQSSLGIINNYASQEEEEEEDEDDKLDVNFEVRAEKLNSNSNDSFADDIYANTAYARVENQTDDSKKAIIGTTTTTNIVEQKDESTQPPAVAATSSKIIKMFNEKVLSKSNFKFFESSTSTTTSGSQQQQHEDQVVVERKRIVVRRDGKKPAASTEQQQATTPTTTTNEDSDAFSIVSQDEIDRIK